MRINNISNKLIWLLTVFLIASFYIFESYSWGKYILAVVAVLVFSISFFKDGRISFIIQPFHFFVLFFAFYCFVSSIWAWSMDEAISKAFTIFQILICLSFLYMHYQKVDSIDSLMSAIMWAGYIIAIYSFISYGGFKDVIALLTRGTRLTNDYTNVNSIGMICAVACVIQVYRVVYNKLSWSALLMIPAILMIAATQSRKALVVLIFGVLAVVVFKNINKKNFLKSFIKILIIVSVVTFCFYLLLQLEIFSGINERMEGLFASFFGKGEEDHSAWLRKQYRIIGLEQFYNTPIFGIGIGSSHILTQRIGESTYLHNNFVELLACGGIVGFAIYYSIYAYLIYQLFKYRKYDKKGFAICIILLAIFLVMDYGMVSYYTKNQYFYFMLLFLEVKNIKRKAIENYKERNREYSKNCLLGKKIYQ